MIRPVRHAPPIVRANLARFAATSAAKDLEESRRTWTFVSWPWTTEYPLAFTLRDERLHGVYVVLEEDGCSRAHWLGKIALKPHRILSPLLLALASVVLFG